MAIFESADKLTNLEALEDELEEQLKAVKAEIKKVNKALSNEMALNEMQNFSRKGRQFYLKPVLRANPASGQKENLYQALKDKGFGSLVTETVNANTLTAFVKEQMALNNPENPTLPEWMKDLVSTFEETVVGTRKA